MRGAAALLFVLGGVALAGWWLNNEMLKSIVPGSSPLKPNIAAGFLLGGSALALMSLRTIGRWARHAIGLMGLAIAVMAGATLVEHFFHWGPGIDQWLVSVFPATTGTGNPGRMMPTTAVCFLWTGLALLARSSPIAKRIGIPLAAGLSAALVMMGLLAFGGFLLELWLGPRWNLLGMSLSGLTAAAGFMILGIGLLVFLHGDGALTWSLDASTTLGFALGIFLTILTTASAFTFGQEMSQTNNWVTHRQEVLKEIQQCMTAMAELAASERVYVIVGDEKLLKNRPQNTEEMKRSLESIRKLTADNLNQQLRLDRLEPLIRQRIEWEEKVIPARRQRGAAAAMEMIATGPGLELSARIVDLLTEMQSEEYTLFNGDRKRAEMASTATFLLLPLGVFVSLGILSLSLFFLNAGIGEQKRAEHRLRASEEQYRELFENNPSPMWLYDLETLAFLAVNGAAVRHYGYSPKRFLAMTIKDIRPREDISSLEDDLAQETSGLSKTTEWRHQKSDGTLIDVEITSHKQMWMGHSAKLVLVNDITARKQAECEVQQLNVELEDRVRSRTADLEAANKELEAFSYSVSHDLRAPLRAVDGFSQALLDDYAEALPDEGRHYLQTIRKGAQQMGMLIDDLLTFSRLSRLPLHKQSVDMRGLARTALDELSESRKARDINVHITNLPWCDGDPALLKQVWINLLSNAIKYTKRRSKAVVDVDSRKENGENIYFIRDNGTGFDMRYAEKLFGVFQRLHRAEEFEGTGVGLAIVQRIVNRHGGRVWAEGALDQGATFYFAMKGTES